MATEQEKQTEQAVQLSRLADGVENLRAEIAAQGALNASRLTTVLDTISRLDATVKTLVYEVQTLKREYVELAERVADLEARAFRDGAQRKRRQPVKKAKARS